MRTATPTEETTFYIRIFPARYFYAVFASCALGIIYGLRVNLNVALASMINHSALNKSVGRSRLVRYTDECPTFGHEKSVEDGPFVWQPNEQAMVLGCYFWGYIFSQIPGAKLAQKYSAKWVIFYAVLANGLCTLLIPSLASVDYAALSALRFLQGFAGGAAIPPTHCMLSKWAPVTERNFMGMIVYSGSSLGVISSMLVAGVLVSYTGWQAVFYVMGSASLLWCPLWAWLIQDTPQKQKLLMSAKERHMIHKELESTVVPTVKGQHLPVPWRLIFSSKPFLALIVAHMCNNWGWYISVFQIPTYMKQVLKFTMTENVLAVGLPFLSLWMFGLFLSRALDWMRNKSIISQTECKKIGTFIATVPPSICLLTICYMGCNRAAVVTLMAVGITALSGMFCGPITNHIDIAPNFAGILMATTNTVATIPAIIGPILVGHITKHRHTIYEWRYIFFTTVGALLVEFVVFTVFGSGNVQPWNTIPQNK